MHPNRLTPEMAAKWPEFVRVTYEGVPIPDLTRVHAMPDEVYKDLIGGTRIREWKAGDGHCHLPCPERMQTWVLVDTTANDVLAFIYVDARIRLVVESWFSTSEIISIAPSHWSAALKTRWPGAIPSVVYPARF